MARNCEAYEDNLIRLKNYFPAAEVLSAKEVSNWAGKDVRTVKKLFPFSASGYISLATLARSLSPRR